MLYTIFSFYKFYSVANPAATAAELLALARQHGLCGTIIVASEGINGCVASARAEGCPTFMAALHEIPGLEELSCRASKSSSPGFKKLMVRVKEQILTFPETISPEAIAANINIDSAAFAEMRRALGENAIILDTRNTYEVACGSFPDAIDLEIDSFAEFPAAFRERLAGQEERSLFMFCTGGIRCEKAAAFAKAEGFRKVYSLDGGILEYFATQRQGQWVGECFVFDDRVVIRPDAVPPHT